MSPTLSPKLYFAGELCSGLYWLLMNSEIKRSKGTSLATPLFRASACQSNQIMHHSCLGEF